MQDNSRPRQPIDVLIVGSGPAALAAAAVLQQAGLRVACYEKGALAQAITQWPYYMKFFSTAANVELPGYPLVLTEDKPTREEYLNYLRRYMRDKQIQVLTGHRVDTLERETDSGFVVHGTDEWGRSFIVRAQFVVVATGAYELPKLMNVPGEELHKVSHYYREVHPYVGQKVAVVGGRNGAAEAALLLWRAGAEVTLIYRGEKLEPLKWWLQPDLENRIRNGEIRALLGTTICEILPHEIVVQNSRGTTQRLENDFVLAMTGYRPETGLLSSAGVVVDPVTRRPRIDPDTFETNVPGLFVAGVIAAGDISNEIFIENSRDHGYKILDGIRKYNGALPHLDPPLWTGASA
ncbi:MAG: YpdA family putative bacillithiol disulfide reductase [Candidatus Sumerlaeaceae bacterium]